MALGLSACTTVESVSKNFALSPSSEKGLLVSSVTYRGSYSGYSVLFRKVGSSEHMELKIGTGTALLPPGMLDWDINRKNGRGNVFAVDLPAGDYEIFSWRVYSGIAFVAPEYDFSIPVKIIPGRATYIGSFNFERKAGLGGTVAAVDVQYGDQSIRDLDILQKKYSGIAPSLVLAGFDSANFGHLLGGASVATFTYKHYGSTFIYRSLQAVAPNEKFPGPLLNINAPNSEGWQLLSRAPDSIAFAKGSSPSKESYVALASVFALPEAKGRDDFAAFIKRNIENKTDPERFNNLESSYEYTDLRGYYCVKYKGVTEDTNAKTSFFKRETLKLQVYFLYCLNTTNNQGGIFVGFSHRGVDTDPNLEKQALSFIDGVKELSR